MSKCTIFAPYMRRSLVIYDFAPLHYLSFLSFILPLHLFFWQIETLPVIASRGRALKLIPTISRKALNYLFFFLWHTYIFSRFLFNDDIRFLPWMKVYIFSAISAPAGPGPVRDIVKILLGGNQGWSKITLCTEKDRTGLQCIRR